MRKVWAQVSYDHLDMEEEQQLQDPYHPASPAQTVTIKIEFENPSHNLNLLSVGKNGLPQQIYTYGFLGRYWLAGHLSQGPHPSTEQLQVIHNCVVKRLKKGKQEKKDERKREKREEEVRA